MKKCKIYFCDEEKIKFYIRGVILGGDPFIQVIPTWLGDEVAIYEEDKAKEYVRMLNDEFSEIDKITFGTEEVE